MSNDYFNHTSPLARHTLGRASAVNAIFNAVVAGFAKLPDAALTNQGRVTFAATGGSANTYTATMPKTWTSYDNGAMLVAEITDTNTGASTLNVDGLGARSIKTFAGDDPAAGDLEAGKAYHFFYDASESQFRMMSYASQDTENIGTVAGISADVTTVAGISAAISAVAAIADEIVVAVEAIYRTKNAQTGDYVLADSDVSNAVEIDAANARSVTIPPDSTLTASVISDVMVYTAGAGPVMIVAGSGVTINSRVGASVTIENQHEAAILSKTAANEWLVTGDIVQSDPPVAANGIGTIVHDNSLNFSEDVSTDFSGTGPITYSLAPGSDDLHSGLSLSSAGVISGTAFFPTGTRTIIVRGENATGFDDTTFDITMVFTGGP